MLKVSKFNRGISFKPDEDSSTGECSCHQFPDEFDNFAVDKITCTFEEPSHVVPVKQCDIDLKGDGNYIDCTKSFDRDWGEEAERVEDEGVMRFRLSRPTYITALKILTGFGKSRTRWSAIRKLRLQYKETHFSHKDIDRAENVRLFQNDWLERTHVLTGAEIDTTEGKDGLRNLYITFSPILTTEFKLFISGKSWCWINEVELYNDCESPAIQTCLTCYTCRRPGGSLCHSLPPG